MCNNNDAKTKEEKDNQKKNKIFVDDAGISGNKLNIDGDIKYIKEHVSDKFKFLKDFF
jgi:hypothetical protein